MSGKEMMIKESLFGGYNKKQTETYIAELQKMIADLQKDSDDILEKCGKLKGQLEEAESCYKTLWETCKDQEDTIKKLTGELESKEKMIRKLTGEAESFEKEIEKMAGEMQEQKKSLELQKQQYLTLEQKHHEFDRMECERTLKILNKIKKLTESKNKKSFAKLEKYLKKQFEKLQ